MTFMADDNALYRQYKNPYTTMRYKGTGPTTEQNPDRGNQPAYASNWSNLVNATNWDNQMKNLSNGLRFGGSSGFGSTLGTSSSVPGTINPSQSLLTPKFGTGWSNTVQNFANRIPGTQTDNTTDFATYYQNFKKNRGNIDTSLERSGRAIDELYNGTAQRNLASNLGNFRTNSGRIIDTMGDTLEANRTGQRGELDSITSGLEGKWSGLTDEDYARTLGNIGTYEVELGQSRRDYEKAGQRNAGLTTNQMISALNAGGMVSPGYGGRRALGMAQQLGAQLGERVGLMGHEDVGTINGLRLGAGQQLGERRIGQAGTIAGQRAGTANQFYNLGNQNAAMLGQARMGIEGTALGVGNQNEQWLRGMQSGNVMTMPNAYGYASSLGLQPIQARQGLTQAEIAAMQGQANLMNSSYFTGINGPGPVSRPYYSGPARAPYDPRQPEGYPQNPYQNPYSDPDNPGNRDDRGNRGGDDRRKKVPGEPYFEAPWDYKLTEGSEIPGHPGFSTSPRFPNAIYDRGYGEWVDLGGYNPNASRDDDEYN
jgi:hypothetical protein